MKENRKIREKSVKQKDGSMRKKKLINLYPDWSGGKKEEIQIHNIHNKGGDILQILQRQNSYISHNPNSSMSTK